MAETAATSAPDTLTPEAIAALVEAAAGTDAASDAPSVTPADEVAAEAPLDADAAVPSPVDDVPAPVDEPQSPTLTDGDRAASDMVAAVAEAVAEDESGEDADEAPQDGSQEQAGRHTSISALLSQYGKYVALFVGAGLISGSVVHFPLAPARYAIIGAVGALVFAIASVVSELGDKDPLRLLRVALSSLALALGIGMISGSIQHFLDIPERAALLIPVGVALSLAAFGLRHGLRLKRGDVALIVPWLIIAVFALGFGLSKLADVAVARGAGGGHGHGAAAASGDGAHGAAEDGGAHGDDSSHGAEGAKEDAAAHGEASGKDPDHGEEPEAAAHGEADAHAEDAAHDGEAANGDDAHADDGAHAEESAHGDDSEDAAAGRGGAAGKKSARDDATDEKSSALYAKDSHRDRIRLVP